jgi:aminoglycoside/choline kinase family phosphotransferase
MERSEQLLTKLANENLNLKVESILPLRAHGSARKIYRIILEDKNSYIGIVNEFIEENLAFTRFSESFRNIGLNVPAIITSDDETAYIETDLGNQTLMDILKSSNEDEKVQVFELYKNAIDHLLKFQTEGLDSIDKKLCYQGAVFDGAAVTKDINYFCEEYLSRVNLWDSKDNLSKDTEELVQICESFDRGYFMYRDFQSRNIMVCDGELFFIDYQSGREGPLQYDLASLLFQSQANLPFDIREDLFDYYLTQSKKILDINPDDFKELYIIFVLVRALQNLGAYGKLGLGQQKEYFKASIPFALRNCEYILNNWPKRLRCFNLRSKLESAVKDAS